MYTHTVLSAHLNRLTKQHSSSLPHQTHSLAVPTLVEQLQKIAIATATNSCSTARLVEGWKLQSQVCGFTTKREPFPKMLGQNLAKQDGTVFQTTRNYMN